MNEETEKPVERLKGLEALRAPFPEAFIKQLPKGTKAQNECPASEKRNCTICGGWHHPNIIHLDYVGHAAVTQRLLDADPKWYWEPLAFDDAGLPALDKNGGMWIKLTVDGMTRLGYGDAGGKTGSNAIKEVIGDALRNAAMRFGVALELWHKGMWENDTVPTPEILETIDEEHQVNLQAFLEEVEADKPAFLKYMGVESLAEITTKAFPKAIAMLEQKRKQRSNK